MTAKRLSDYGVGKASIRVYTVASPTGQDIGDIRIYGGAVSIWDGSDWVDMGGNSAFAFFTMAV